MFRLCLRRRDSIGNFPRRGLLRLAMTWKSSEHHVDAGSLGRHPHCRSVKLDNLVQVGHNCQSAHSACIAAQAGFVLLRRLMYWKAGNCVGGQRRASGEAMQLDRQVGDRRAKRRAGGKTIRSGELFGARRPFAGKVQRVIAHVRTASRTGRTHQRNRGKACGK